MTGMLWLDDSKESLETKVTRAAEYYFKKYGVRAACCHVNPKTAGILKVVYIFIVDATDIKIIPDTTILPKHFWFLPGDKQ
jgi:hypothetical protein